MSEQTIDNELTAEQVLAQEDRDLGFGAVVAGQSRRRLLNPDGSFNVQRTGLPFTTSLNLYHSVLAMSWRTFLGMVLLLYFASNIVFGMLYMSIGANALVDTSSEPLDTLFARAFFFSVQTFATIGYGTIHPVGILPNLLVTVESYYSLLVNALVTGVVFARFSRPSAKIILSTVAVIAPYRGITGLMFRMYNGRKSQLIEVGAQVMFSRIVNDDGRAVRKFDLLELERKRVAFLPLAWTVVHPIDENSPLHGLTENDLKWSDAEVLILLSATDETFLQTVHMRSSYKPEQIMTGYKFTSIYNEMQEDEPISINVRKLSEVEPAQI